MKHTKPDFIILDESDELPPLTDTARERIREWWEKHGHRVTWVSGGSVRLSLTDWVTGEKLKK